MDAVKAALALERMARAIAELEGGEDRGRRTEDGGRPEKARGQAAANDVDPTQPELRAAWRKRWTRHMVGVFGRQRDVVLKRAKAIPDIAVLWDGPRWDAELTGDFRKLSAATTLEFAQYVADQLGCSWTRARWRRGSRRMRGSGRRM